MYARALLILFLLAFTYSLAINKTWASCLGLGCTCTIAVAAVSFGTYDPKSATPNDTTGTATVTCSALVLGLLVSYDIELSSGNNNNYFSRAMNNGTYNLNYNFFIDASRTQVWGDDNGGTGNVSDNYLLNISPTIRPYTIYGRIPAGQNVGSGSYNDSIVASVIF